MWLWQQQTGLVWTEGIVDAAEKAHCGVKLNSEPGRRSAQEGRELPYPPDA
jgi:hypothetical protein